MQIAENKDKKENLEKSQREKNTLPIDEPYL